MPNHLDYARPSGRPSRVLRLCAGGLALAILLSFTFFFALDWTFYENGAPHGEVLMSARIIISGFLGFAGAALISAIIVVVYIFIRAVLAMSNSSKTAPKG